MELLLSMKPVHSFPLDLLDGSRIFDAGMGEAAATTVAVAFAAVAVGAATEIHLDRTMRK